MYMSRMKTIFNITGYDIINIFTLLKTTDIVFIVTATSILTLIQISTFYDPLLGTGVTVNSLHPGSVATELGRYFPGFSILYPTLTLFFKSPWEGAQTNIHCAVEESLENVTGKYFRYCSRNVVIVNLIS